MTISPVIFLGSPAFCQTLGDVLSVQFFNAHIWKYKVFFVSIYGSVQSFYEKCLSSFVQKSSGLLVPQFPCTYKFVKLIIVYGENCRHTAGKKEVAEHSCITYVIQLEFPGVPGSNASRKIIS